MGRNICELRLGNGFLGMTLKTQATKEITDKLDIVKIKTSALQRTHRMGEIFANHIYVYRIL